MKNRVIRVSDDLWNKAMDLATERQESLSEILRDALKRYVEGNDR